MHRVLKKDSGLRLDLNERGYLSPLHESDVTQAYVDGLNDPEVNCFLMGPRSQRQTMASVQAFVRWNRESEDGVLLGLYVDGVLRGTTRLHGASTSEINLGLALFDKSVWGQGWGRLMITEATRYALNEIGVTRVIAGIEVDNIASQKAFLAAGYKCIQTAYSSDHDAQIQTWEYPG